MNKSCTKKRKSRNQNNKKGKLQKINLKRQTKTIKKTTFDSEKHKNVNNCSFPIVLHFPNDTDSINSVFSRQSF